MVKRYMRQHGTGDVLRDGQDHAIKGGCFAVCFNRRRRNRRDGGAKVDGGGPKLTCDLFWNGTDTVLGHDHLAVGHSAPSEIGKRHAFRERRVKSDAGKKGFEDAACLRMEFSAFQTVANAGGRAVH